MRPRSRRRPKSSVRHAWSRTKTPAGCPMPMRRSSAGSAMRGGGRDTMLALPTSRAQIGAIQTKRKRRAVEQAKRAAFYAGKLDHVDLDRLDDADEWRKIPILTKDMLRSLS